MQSNPSADSKATLPLLIFLLVLLFATMAHIVADIYVPSLPAITQAFHTGQGIIQLTLAAFMLGCSGAQLFYGPISDRIGRRQPMLFGMGFLVLGSLVCFLAPSVYVFIFGRFIQGLGVAACYSVGRSLIRDLIIGPELAKISSHLGMLMVFVTAIAPTLGGYIQHYFNWRAIFLVLFIYTSLVGLLTWKKLPETNKNLNPNATQMHEMFRNYWQVITNKSFLGYTICTTTAYAGIIAYVTVTPFLLQNIVGLTPVQYGWLAFVVGTAIFTSFFINSRYVMEKGINKMLLAGVCLMSIAGILMLAFASLHYLNVFVVMLPVAFFCMGAGFAFSNSAAGAFHQFPRMLGSVGAVYGCIQILGGAAASSIMAMLHLKNQVPLGVTFLALGLLSLAAWKWMVMAVPAGERVTVT